MAQAGIKEKNRKDLTVFLLSEGTVVCGVFTQNLFRAAPVKICEENLNRNCAITALVINTGYANAGTGSEGLSNAIQTCISLGRMLCVPKEQILPFSTGVVLEHLPLNKLIDGLPIAVQNLNQNNWFDAAQAIMTTDTLPKIASKQVQLNGQAVNFTGISKGSGMICPNMATMLAFIATDAWISKELLQKLISEISNVSFNRITVEGDTSTNDSFIIAATGKSGIVVHSESDEHYLSVRQNLMEIAIDLAKKIVQDGEGATKFIEICIWNAKNSSDALKVAYSIANSALVKTAFYASELNLGRVLVAIGFSGIGNLNINNVAIHLNDSPIFIKGKQYQSFQEKKLKEIMKESNLTLHISLGMGNSHEKVYTCDMSHDYISINSKYRS